MQKDINFLTIAHICKRIRIVKDYQNGKVAVLINELLFLDRPTWSGKR